MRFVLTFDLDGIICVQIHSTPEESATAHRLFQTLRPTVEQFGTTVARLCRGETDIEPSDGEGGAQ